MTNISFEPVIDLNSKAFHRTLAKQGFKFKLSTKVVGTEKLADGRVGVKVEAAKGGDAETVSVLHIHIEWAVWALYFASPF